MSDIKLSAYVSAFNLLQNGFDYQSSLGAMVEFFDEVVVAVNSSSDGTLETLRVISNDNPHGWPRLKVIETSFAYTDVSFDGAIKNAALQACSKDENRVYVQMDMDEMIPFSQYDLWREYAKQLISTSHIDCFMIPSIDLWGSKETIRDDKPIGVKFRMHKEGLKRGVWPRAWVVAGKRFDTSMSDSCELLALNGELARAIRVVPDGFLSPAVISMLEGYPYTFHFGYVDYEQRVRVNKAIWAGHWPLRSGHSENVATRVQDLMGVNLVKHNLPLV